MITREDILALMHAAGCHGDTETVRLCRLALAGRGGRREIARILEWSRRELEEERVEPWTTV